MTRVPEIVLREPGRRAHRQPRGAGMSSADVEKANKRQTELKACSTSRTPRSTPATSTRLSPVHDDQRLRTCAACYVRIGDVYLKKNDLANAEKSYLQAIEFDPKLPEPYRALASIYNHRRSSRKPRR